MDRNSASNAAFACVIDVDGVNFKLARHHYLDKVRDGSEHDTVDPKLLSLSLRMVDQLPVDSKEKEAILAHLRAHEKALASDPQPNDLNSKDVNRETTENNPERAREIVGSQAGGVDGNATLQTPAPRMAIEPRESTVVRKEGGTAVAELTPKGGKKGTVLKGGTTLSDGTKESSPNNVNGDKESIKDQESKTDVESKTGTGSPAHGPKVSEGNDDKSMPNVEKDGQEIVVNNPNKDKEGDAPVSKSAEKDKKKAQLETDKDMKAPEEDEKDTKKAKNKKKIKASINDWVRNQDGIVGVITGFTADGKPQVKIPRGTEGVSQSGWRVIVKASEVDFNKPESILYNELKILDTPEALKKFATPTDSGQSNRNLQVCLCSSENLTEEGKQFFNSKFLESLEKSTAKVLSVDKIGSLERIALKIEGESDYPYYMDCEVSRDGEGNIIYVRLFNEYLDKNMLKDVGKFLSSLSSYTEKLENNA